ncbi:hypothetical protein ACLIBG_00550 [Virgibacillus sp. W0181]|uniref:hypothetical protein n=1 Tax=Virgibacillus sp. W0181 TaxID=3391581 RepID=UPI003F488F81
MLIIYGFGAWSLIATIYCYFRFKRRKQLFDDRFATTISKTATLISTMVLSIHLTVLLPIELSTIFILNILLGISAGWVFGSLVKYHSVLAGFYNGLIGSSMGVMIGEVLKNPQICSIPISNQEQILLNIYQLCGFATFLLTLVLSLVLYSLRV